MPFVSRYIGREDNVERIVDAGLFHAHWGSQSKRKGHLLGANVSA